MELEATAIHSFIAILMNRTEVWLGLETFMKQRKFR